MQSWMQFITGVTAADADEVITHTLEFVRQPEFADVEVLDYTVDCGPDGVTIEGYIQGPATQVREYVRRLGLVLEGD